MNPERIGRYVIREQIGRGGMATVYRAWDPNFEREVAVKVLPREHTSDLEFLQRFQREARTVANLEHYAIVPVHDFGQHEGQPFLVMRLMDGGSLEDRIAGERLPLPAIEALLARLSSALDFAHQQGIVHRDLKPANILFDEWQNAYLTDFGIVKVAGGSGTQTGIVMGTPAYMSPEQARGMPIDHRADIYSLGVIVYEMLTGQQPYRAETPMGQAMAHIVEPVPRLRPIRDDLPDGFEEVIRTAMAKDPADRYPTAGALTQAFTEVSRAIQAPTLPPVATTPAPAPAVSAPPAPATPPPPPPSALDSFIEQQQKPRPTPTLIDSAPPPTNTPANPVSTPRSSRAGVSFSPIGCGILAVVGLIVAVSIGSGIYAFGGFANPQPTRTPTMAFATSTPSVSIASQITPTVAPTPVPPTVPPTTAPVVRGDPVEITVGNAALLGLWQAQPAHAGDVNAIAVSPAGDEWMTAGSDGMVTFWQFTNGSASLRTTTSLGVALEALDWGVENRLAAGANDGRLFLWQSPDAQPTTIDAHTAAILALALSPDGSRLATASADGQVRVWNARTGQLLVALTPETSPWSLAWSPDGTYLAVGAENGLLEIWQPPQQTRLTAVTDTGDTLRALSWSPDGRWLAGGASSLSSGKILVWDATNPAAPTLTITLTEGLQRIVELAWSPTDPFLLAAISNSSNARNVFLFDTERGQLLTNQTTTANFQSLAWTPDATLLLTGDRDGNLQFWIVP